jgi:hypothetical protein
VSVVSRISHGKQAAAQPRSVHAYKVALGGQKMEDWSVLDEVLVLADWKSAKVDQVQRAVGHDEHV